MGGGRKKPQGANKATGTSDGNEVKQAREEAKKSSGKVQQKQKLSVLIEESQGRKAIQDMKVITTQGVARVVGVKVSVANSYLRSLEVKGTIRSIGGYSGHRVYKLLESS